MTDNPALLALIDAKHASVVAGMRARYGAALEAYFFSGVYDPILAEIGYDGTEVSPAEFGGLGRLIDVMPEYPVKPFITAYPPAPPFWQTLRQKRPGRRR